MFAAKTTLQTSVIPSPNVTPPSPFREINPIPTRQMTAESRWFARGFSPLTSQYRNGTMTQYAAVRNALLPGLVPKVIAAVWSHVPNDIVIPVASPPNRYPLSILCHFFIVARAVITPAAEKRAATIKDALNSSAANF